ncbi:MAG: cation:proton antiporter [Thermoplasmata archaeon]|nr:cation:proton antiporter [Thermoplasmata archaeon]
MVVNSFDLALVAVFGTIVVTALVSRRTQLPITAIEIAAGISLVALLGFGLPDGTSSILVLGSLFIVFLAGLETNFDFLRRNLRRALTVGVPGFFLPFLGLFSVLYWGLRAPLLISVIGATALADTSISIVYTTLQQYDLTELPFGRLVLAATLSVNLVEDVTITSTTFFTSTGIAFTLVVLGMLGAAAVLLPRFQRALTDPGGPAGFANLPARGLLFSLAVLAFLSTLVGVPGILFVFLMGLLFSRWAGEWFLKDVRQLAFAVFVPLYFLAVGLRVDPAYLIQHWSLIATLVVVATALKVGTIYPIGRWVFGTRRAAPIAVLMNTRLTSATVILTLTLGLGLITVGWYTVLITTVVVLALGSSAALRGFPEFRSREAAQDAFRGGNELLPEPRRGTRLPTPILTTDRHQLLR